MLCFELCRLACHCLLYVHMSETLLQCRQLVEACYMLLQATVYESDLSPDAHPALRALFDVRNNDDEYNTMLNLFMDMLSPEIMRRATVEEALESQLFADV